MNLEKLMQFNNPPGKIKNNMTTPHLKKSIGSSSSRLALLLIALVFTCLGLRQNAQAGYIVTLQQVGPNVVATGSGAINLTGLTFFQSDGVFSPEILPGAGVQAGGGILTGPTSSSVDLYFEPRGPTSFGSGGATPASSGSGDMVGIFPIHLIFERALIVPRGYVSGTFLSNSATYSGKTFATLGVTPGTYVWTWGTGANQNFTLQIPVPPPPVTGPPVAITNPATLIASFAANLNGSVNPHGLTTNVYFQYGTTNSYGLTTAPQSHTGNTSVNISAHIRGLTASTTYHFRIVTTNSAGTRYGSDTTFTTLPPTGFPIVTTKPATDVATFAATLNGLLDPHGLTTSVYFQYGTTTNYGRTTAVQSQTGNTYRNIAANINGLSRNTTYHFRIVATNSVGTRYGSDRTFTTQ
ncbi:MAG: hypothetical protein WA269_08975 [Candidatus Udaeobacter sp.]